MIRIEEHRSVGTWERNMREWLYKARDVARNGEPRTSYDVTRDFAVQDGVLCRSARSTADPPALIPNVQKVGVGDVIHMFYRQHVPNKMVRVIGSFRVRDPGALRLEEGLELALTGEGDLARRLRVAYGVKPGKQVTAWFLEPAADVVTPVKGDPEVAKFLRQNPTLVEYHGHARP